MKKLSKMLLIPAALVAMAIPMTGANAAELAGEETVVLKATGMVTYSFEEEQDEDWADAVDTIYIREMPADISEEVTEDMMFAWGLLFRINVRRILRFVPLMEKEMLFLKRCSAMKRWKLCVRKNPSLQLPARCMV